MFVNPSVSALTLQNLTCNCFGAPKKKKSNVETIQAAYDEKNLNIRVLPMAVDYMPPLQNLYPKSNMVQLWSSFCIGNDGNYILANYPKDFPVYKKPEDLDDDDSTECTRIAAALLNQNGNGVMQPELKRFLDPIWSTVLTGKCVDLLAIIANRTFHVTAYPLKRQDGHAVGAVAFLRLLDYSSTRLSLDMARAIDVRR